ncbi:MAG: AAA family ATPase [Polyangiaceae bacterium]
MDRAPERVPQAESSRRGLVGRTAELAELQAAFEQALATRGRLFLVSGEPGIGKTRLADEASELASGLGFSVLWGRCWEAGGAPAYWPWLEVLRALSDRLSDADLSLLGDGTSTLVGLVPTLGSRLAETLAPVSGNPDEARFRLYRSVLALVRSTAREQGLFIVLEDLHAADESSLGLLQFLARELRGTRACLLATFRDVEARLSVDVGEALGRLSREATTLSLSRLAEAEAERFVHDRIGAAPPAVVSELIRRSQGNPLFLSELLGLLQRQGNLDAALGQLPFGVREVIRQRVALVSPTDRALLELAAVSGDEPDALFLSRAAACEPGSVASTLSRALNAGLLTTHEGQRFRFSHALVREVLVSDLSIERRRALHSRAAAALAATCNPSQLPHAELAHHLLEGEPEALPSALSHAIAAAERALALFAFEDAIALLERARSALETQAPGSQLSGQLLVALGRAHLRRGAGKLGQALCEQAAELARRQNDPTLLAEAALAYGLEITAALVNPALVRLLEEALAALPEPDSALRVRVTARLAAALQPHPNLAYPIGLAEQAIAAARRLGDRETLLDAMFTGISAMMDIVDPRERLPQNLEIEQMAADRGDTERLLRTEARLVFDHMELGDFTAADARIALFERLANEAGAERYLWRVPLFRSMRAMIHGRFAEAEASLERARQLGAAAKDPLLERCYVFHREGLLRAWERHDDLVSHDVDARRMRAALYSGPHWQNGGSAFTYARVEDLDKARLYLELIPDDDWPLVHNPPAFMHLGEPLALVGRPHAVQRVYDLLLPAAHRCLSWGYTKFIWDGNATRVLGLLAAKLGHWETAQGFFERAIQQLTELCAGPYLARTRYEYGRALVASEDSEARVRGRQLLEEASTLASTLEMAGLVRLCERRHEEKPGRQRSLPAVASLPPLTITPEGDTWHVSFGAEAFRLRDRLGMRYLARLVENPNRGLTALELSSGAQGESEPPVDAGDSGELLDQRARESYRARLRELQRELAEAEGFADLGRAQRLRQELDFLSSELSRAVGLGGRSRRAGAAAERARSAVQRRIKNAVERIREQSPALAELIERCVKTGSECIYLPERAAR